MGSSSGWWARTTLAARSPGRVGRAALDLWNRSRSWSQDIALSGLVMVLVVFHASVAPPERTDLDAGGYALVLIGAASLSARRRAPVAVLLLSTGAMFTYQVLGYPGVAPGLPVLVAIYTAVRAGHRVLPLVVTLVALTKGAAATLLMTDSVDSVREVVESRLLLAGWLIASGVIGEVARKQQAYLQQVEERAAEAERSREEAALRRAGEERLRIARELHDSLTHSISVIKVQAGVAAHLARKRGEDVPEAVQAIEVASNDAVRELRATLDVLRDDHRRPGGLPSDLDRLPELVTTARLAGVSATVTVRGERRELPSDVDRAAYRIVQEALTNVTRHAGPAEATILLDYRQPDELAVQIDDNGRATPDAEPVPGVGLRGMRERVAALGGRLDAAPRSEGGFTVRAELPVGPAIPVGGSL